MKSTSIRLIVLVISLLGLVVPFFNAPPVLVMIMSQAFGAALLPATVTCILYLGNNEKVMGIHTFNTLTNITTCLILLFSLFIAYNSLKGFLYF